MLGAGSSLWCECTLHPQERLDTLHTATMRRIYAGSDEVQLHLQQIRAEHGMGAADIRLKLEAVTAMLTAPGVRQLDPQTIQEVKDLTKRSSGNWGSLLRAFKQVSKKRIITRLPTRRKIDKPKKAQSAQTSGIAPSPAVSPPLPPKAAPPAPSGIAPPPAAPPPLPPPAAPHAPLARVSMLQQHRARYLSREQSPAADWQQRRQHLLALEVPPAAPPAACPPNLRNHGNTCFASAAVQLLLHSRWVQQYLERDHPHNRCGGVGCWLCALQRFWSQSTHRSAAAPGYEELRADSKGAARHPYHAALSFPN